MVCLHDNDGTKTAKFFFFFLSFVYTQPRCQNDSCSHYSAKMSKNTVLFMLGQ